MYRVSVVSRMNYFSDRENTRQKQPSSHWPAGPDPPFPQGFRTCLTPPPPPSTNTGEKRIPFLPNISNVSPRPTEKRKLLPRRIYSLSVNPPLLLFLFNNDNRVEFKIILPFPLLLSLSSPRRSLEEGNQGGKEKTLGVNFVVRFRGSNEFLFFSFSFFEEGWWERCREFSVASLEEVSFGCWRGNDDRFAFLFFVRREV